MNFVPTWTDAEGRTVFFPYGRFGKGRVVNEQQLGRVRTLNVLAFSAGLLLVVLTGHIGWSLLARLVLVVPLAIVYYGALYAMTRDLPVSSPQHRWIDGVAQSARAFGQPVWWASIAMGAFLTYKLTSLIASRGFLPTDIFIGAFVAVMLGLGMFGVWVCRGR